MTSATKLRAILAVVVVSLVGVWHCSAVSAARRDAVLAVSADSLDRGVETLRQDLHRLALVNGARADSILTLKHQDSVAQVATTKDSTTAKAAESQVRSALPEADWGFLDQLDSAWQAALADKQAQIDRWKGIALFYQHAYQDDSSALVRVNAALSVAITQRDEYKAEAHPGLFKQAVSALPWMAASLVADRVVH